MCAAPGLTLSFPQDSGSERLRTLVEAEAVRVVEALLLGGSAAAPLMAMLPRALQQVSPWQLGLVSPEEEAKMTDLREQVGGRRVSCPLIPPLPFPAPSSAFVSASWTSQRDCRGGASGPVTGSGSGSGSWLVVYLCAVYLCAGVAVATASVVRRRRCLRLIPRALCLQVLRVWALADPEGGGGLSSGTVQSILAILQASFLAPLRIRRPPCESPVEAFLTTIVRPRTRNKCGLFKQALLKVN